MARFLHLMAVFVFPAWCLDGCANRDPRYRLDASSQLIAHAATAPLSFDFRDASDPASGRFQLHDVSEFRMHDSVFTGKTGDRFFIVARPGGARELFDTREERDAALHRDHATSPRDLREKPWHCGLRANVFFPYNFIYYASATAVVAAVCVARRPPAPPKNPGNAATSDRRR